MSVADRYLRLHRQLHDGATRLLIGADDPVEFWTWYAAAVRGPGVVTVVRTDEAAPGFPEPTGSVAVWIDGKSLESAYTRHELEHVKPEIYRDADHGPLSTFARAAISAGAGHSVSYVGMSLDVLAPATGPGIDATPSFLDAWNRSHPDHRIRSLCADLAREEVLRRALAEGVEFCDCETGDGWCGDCFGCFELFQCAAAIGHEPGFRLTPRVVDEVHGHYQAYLASGFATNYRGAMQRLLRLHARGQVEMERTAHV